MKNEFIYPVEGIFGEALSSEGLSRYYIGPYQRGYKWSSANCYDQVPQLLVDVADAMDKGIGDYFLQFITVLKTTDGEYELIDGQQRLTTLALIFARLNQADPGIANIAAGKLRYQRFQSNENLVDTLGRRPKGSQPDDSSQDRHYLSHAVECIDRFVDILASKGKLTDFDRYLRKNVKIILNRESENVKPEEAFVNLNGNNVPLTNAFLIKGLILTKNVMRNDRLGRPLDYFNIMEQRRVNGRLWDEIQNWFQQKDVCHFFFGKDAAKDTDGIATQAMEHFLRLLLPTDNEAQADKAGSDIIKAFVAGFDSNSTTENNDSGYRLFNRFNDLIATDEDGQKYMNRLIRYYKRFRSLYEDPKFYNLLGLCLFGDEKHRIDQLRKYIAQSEKVILKELAQRAQTIIPNLKDSAICYKDKRLTPLLLSFNVFPEGGKIDSVKFNFPRYDTLRWEYEHVRPQNPKESISVPDICRAGVIALIDSDTANYPEGLETDQLKTDIAHGNDISVDSIPTLYATLSNVDDMGNMALLKKENNIQVSNYPYIVKRILIMDMMKKGEFIPPHTAAVFSKSLNLNGCKQFSTDLARWEQNDVDAHHEWMMKRNEEIRTELKELEEQA